MLVVAVLMLVVGGAADMASAAFRTSMLQSAASDAVRGRLQGVFTGRGRRRSADRRRGPRRGRGLDRRGGDRGRRRAPRRVGTVLAAVAFPAFIRYRVVAATGRVSVERQRSGAADRSGGCSVISFSPAWLPNSWLSSRTV